MSQARRASSELRDKTNIHPVNNRRHEATAEDFQELGEIIQDHAERIDLFQNESFRSEFYGYFQSIEVLEATYPTAEQNAFAIILDLDGRPKQIAKWNDTSAEWELTEMGEVIYRANRRADFPHIGDENVIYYAKDSGRSYIWYDLDYHDLTPPSGNDIILGSYINESTFHDEWGNPLSLKKGKLYVDEADWYYFNGTELTDLLPSDAFYTYPTIPALLNDQSNQNEQQIYLVADASADTSLKFPPGVGKHAFYKYNGTATGNLNNYTLIASPNAISGHVVDTYSDQKIAGLKGIIGRIYYDDVDNVIIELLDEDLAPKKYVDLESFKNLLDSNNKIKDQYIPALAIVDMVDANEDTFAGFLANAENYTFEKGDFIQITDVEGNREYYFYNGGDKTDGANYAPMSTEKIPWGNVSGKPTIDIDYVAGEGNETTKELKLGKVTVDSVVTRGGTDRDVVLGDGELRRLFGTELGYAALALGLLAEATEPQTTAIGYLSRAQGDGSVAIGQQANTTEGRATAIGSQSKATGHQSTAVGFNAEALHTRATAVGRYVKTSKGNQVVLGVNNAETQDDLIVGRGSSHSARMNLLEVNSLGESQLYGSNQTPRIQRYKADFEPEEFTEDKMLPNVKYVNTTTDRKIEVAVTKGVYGIEYDVTHAAPEVTRIGDMECHKTLPLHSKMRRCILDVDGNVEYYLGDYDSTLREDGNPAYLDGTDGDVMVEIPEHYEAYFSAGNINTVLVSMNSFYGSRRVPKSYISAYKTTLDRNNPNSIRLASVASEDDRYRGGNGTETWMNGIASSNYSLTQYKEFAKNKGSVFTSINGAWTPAWYELRKKVAWLITIEYATRLHRQPINTQLTPEGYKQGGLGLGPTGVNDADWNAYNGRYSIFKCGTTNSLGNQTGEVAVTIPDFNGTTLNTVAMSYRGIENFFGDIWEWTDGIILDADQNPPKAYAATSLNFDITKNHGRYIGEVPTANGYIKEVAFGEHGDIVAKDNAGASSTTFFTDYFWRSNSGLRVFAFGARLNHSDGSGSFSANTASTASNANPYCGSRLCFITRP